MQCGVLTSFVLPQSRLSNITQCCADASFVVRPAQIKKRWKMPRPKTPQSQFNNPERLMHGGLAGCTSLLLYLLPRSVCPAPVTSTEELVVQFGNGNVYSRISVQQSMPSPPFSFSRLSCSSVGGPCFEGEGSKTRLNFPRMTPIPARNSNIVTFGEI